MPKLKTSRGAAKRFKFTKKGKIKRGMAGRSHILTKKSRKRKRYLRKAKGLNLTDTRRIRKLLPYG